MKGFLSVFKNSANELKSPVTLSVTGMLIALYIVLKIFATVYVTDNLRITFAFLALATIGMLYGPSVAFFAGAIGDVLGYFMAPTGGGYFVGYTLTYAIEGLIFGVMLYHKIHNSRITSYNVCYTKLLRSSLPAGFSRNAVRRRACPFPPRRSG